MRNEFIDDWFTFLTLYNTNLGIMNFQRNKEQESKQEIIEKKIDEILTILKERGEKNV